jgi:release factor glutamine methyltransferase
MKIREALENAEKLLNDNNIEDSYIISKLLLIFVLKVDKQYLVINKDENIEEEQYIKYKELLQKIIEGVPLQYITKNQEFMKLNFYVDENVLIPQPDTEILVENVLEICNKKNNEDLKILDLCTGSGAIAISIYNELKHVDVFASDISKKALEVAIKNNKLNGTNVKFIESDLFENINQKFDIIVSNPPYIKTKTIKTLSKQVQNEPKLALDGGEDGLDLYRRIINEAYNYINDEGYLCLEIGYDQKEDVQAIFNKYNNYKEIKVIKDLSKNDRCIITKVKNN